MAIKCNPCECVDQYYKNEWTWKRAVLDALCQVVSYVSGGNNAVTSSLTDGRKTVTTAATAEKIIAAVTPCKRVDIVAETDNTGIIVVGASTVVAALGTRRGVPLNKGDFYSVEIDDASKLYIDSTVNGDGVSFVIYV